MKITNSQIEKLKRDGFVIIEQFLSDEELKSASDGFYQWYAPPYEQFLKDGYENTTPSQPLFPWEDSGLNHVTTHPDLIDAAERIIGTREIRLCEAHLGVKYSNEKISFGSKPHHFHLDYPNNSFGPCQQTDDFSHLIFFYIFEDVKPGMAPILMVPKGKDASEAVPMIAPKGSLCIYTPYTLHAASEFTVPGHRAVEWVGFCRKDRMWDGARTFTYKSGAGVEAMKKFIVEASPRQLELIGFPPPEDSLWTKEFLEGMEKRYEGFNTKPYYEAQGYKVKNQ